MRSGRRTPPAHRAAGRPPARSPALAAGRHPGRPGGERACPALLHVQRGGRHGALAPAHPRPARTVRCSRLEGATRVRRFWRYMAVTQQSVPRSISKEPLGFTLVLRPGHPDFLDLPWREPLEGWRSARLVALEAATPPPLLPLLPSTRPPDTRRT